MCADDVMIKVAGGTVVPQLFLEELWFRAMLHPHDDLALQFVEVMWLMGLIIWCSC